MTEPNWLDRRVVLAVHDRQLAEHGGAPGLRDSGLLDSALARPQPHATYGHPDIAELAALYAIAIAHNHPFIDGNKRTAYVALELFLAKNGAGFDATDTESVLMMLGMASREIDDATFVGWVRGTVGLIEARVATPTKLRLQATEPEAAMAGLASPSVLSPDW